MRIQHNIMAMNSYRNYTNNANGLSKNLEKLSSGYKINRAGDDAAGLAISEKMRAQITGLDAAQKNVKDGVSLVKTAEGAMDEIHSMLKRMDYLATQSANGTYDEETDRDQLQKEINQLREEINRIADSSNFNGIKLLDGSLSGKSQVSNLTINTTKVQKGQYSISTIASLAGLGSALSTEDIGKTIDYTVTWKDSNGQVQTTTVTLTYQGNGKGVHATKDYTTDYFTDASGKKYKLDGDGKLTTENIINAISNGLKSNDNFNNNFQVTPDAANGKITMEARKDGTAGAVILSIGAHGTTKINPYDSAASGVGSNFSMTLTVDKTPYDALHKFNGTDPTVADNSYDDIEDVLELIFEVDGHKFLLNAGGSTGLKADMIRALGKDVTIITLASAAFSASKDAEKLAAEISRVTGLEVTGYASAVPNAEIDAGDIVFKEKLKLQGNELQLQIGDTADAFNQLKVKIKDLHTTAIGINEIDISTQDGAAAAIDYIKDAINYVSDVRGTLGATQNRLEHTQNNLSVMAENIQDAESTIRDTDVAEEMMSYVKNNILVQSAQAMLAQANQVPQGVLQLLG